MKKAIILSTFLFAAVTCFSQATDSTKKDSVRTFAIIVTEPEYSALINFLKTADEKPSVINAWITLLNSRLQLLAPVQLLEPPKKEKPKK